jgi:hypothetical protein
MWQLDLSNEVASDSTGGNLDKGDELVDEEHLDVSADGLDADGLDTSVRHEEQVMLLELASDMWSQVNADATFRAAADEESTSLPPSQGSKSSASSFFSIDGLSEDSRAANLFRKAFHEILIESGETFNKSSLRSDDVDVHSDDDVSRAKAFLVKVLSPIGSKICDDGEHNFHGMAAVYQPETAKVIGQNTGYKASLGCSPSSVSTTCPNTPSISPRKISNTDPLLSPTPSSRTLMAQPVTFRATAHKGMVPGVTALPTTLVTAPSSSVVYLGDRVITTTTATTTTVVSQRNHGRRVILV